MLNLDVFSHIVQTSKLEDSDENSLVDCSEILPNPRVILSSDGNTVIIGTYGANNAVTSNGEVYIYARSGNTWTQQAKLVANDIDNDVYLGCSVGIADDGNTVIVGAVSNSYNDNGSGSAYIFTRSGTTWIQQAKLTASDTVSHNRFGSSVSLSGDGNTAIIGAFKHNSDNGSAYIYARTDDTWDQQAKLIASDRVASVYFGMSVGLSTDGNTTIVGAVGKKTNRGAAYIFTRSGSTWIQESELMTSDGVAHYSFGVNVKLHTNGDAATVGGYCCDDEGSLVGAVYDFTRSGSTWTQQAKTLTSTEVGSNIFAHRLCLSSDCNTAALIRANDLDAAYIYTQTDNNWSQLARLPAVDGEDVRVY